MKVIYLVLKRLFDEINELTDEELTPLKMRTIVLKYMNNQAK